MRKYGIKKECKDGMRYWSYFKRENHTYQGYWSLPAHQIPFNAKEVQEYNFFTANLMVLYMRIHGTKAEVIRKWW